MGRQVQIGLSKPKADTTPEQEGATFEHKVHTVTRVLERSITKIGLAVCAYVAVDTVRQVVVKSIDR